ncbi:MAG TPA: hypothetical protein VKA34_01320 [Balneolales bacterium]|nr:hypothetical protein [Balneolales bacterium]
MEDMKNQKDELNKIIKKLGESIDSNAAKKINFKQLDRVSKRLIEFFDECDECQNYTYLILKFSEDTNRFLDINKKELESFNSNVKIIISHMQKKHNLFVEGYFVSIYIALGLIMGTAIGTSLKNLALGISLGMLIGVAVGVAVDANYKKKGLVI